MFLRPVACVDAASSNLHTRAQTHAQRHAHPTHRHKQTDIRTFTLADAHTYWFTVPHEVLKMVVFGTNIMRSMLYTTDRDILL